MTKNEHDADRKKTHAYLADDKSRENAGWFDLWSFKVHMVVDGFVYYSLSEYDGFIS